MRALHEEVLSEVWHVMPGRRMLQLNTRGMTHPLEVHHFQANMTDQLPYLLQADPDHVRLAVK